MSEIVVIIRPSFMKFCQDGCRAALFNHILYWIAKKAKGQPRDKILSGEVAYYATTDELVEDLAKAWKYQKVRQEVNDLINMGLIGRGKNLQFKADRTKHFYFGKVQYEKLLEFCQKHSIDLSKIGLSSEVTDMIKQFTNMSNAFDESVKCTELEQFTNMSNANDKYVRAITQVSTQDNHTQDSNTEKREPHASTSPNGSSALHSSVSELSQNLSKDQSKPSRQRVSSPKSKVPDGPVEMPAQTAAWPSAETAVQIIEAKKGRRYSTTTRKQELTEAHKLLEMTFENAPISREQFEYAWDQLSASPWWEEHGKPPMLKYLRRDDSIITILRKRANSSTSRSSAPSTPKPASSSSQPITSARVSQEAKQRNRERLLQGI